MLKTWSNDNWKIFLVFHKLLEILGNFYFIVHYEIKLKPMNSCDRVWSPRRLSHCQRFSRSTDPGSPLCSLLPSLFLVSAPPTQSWWDTPSKGVLFLSSMGKILWYLKKFLSVLTNVHSIRIFTTIIISTF